MTDDNLHLLTIDIGNTLTSVALFRGEEIIRHFRISSTREKTSDEWEMLFSHFLTNHPKIDATIFISVVPPIGTQVHKALQQMDIDAHFISPRHLNLMEILVDNPPEVGADRLVNAFAAREIYGAPAVVVDLGTATTWDVVDSDGNFLGGAIAPGIEASARSLFESTAKLPRIRIERPHSAIGKNTITAMESGVYYGVVETIEGLTRRIAREMEADPIVVATGGLAELVAQDCPIINKVDPSLLYKGLRLIYHRMQK
jgi:type III pantothenate kinase